MKDTNKNHFFTLIANVIPHNIHIEDDPLGLSENATEFISEVFPERPSGSTPDSLVSAPRGP